MKVAIAYKRYAQGCGDAYPRIEDTRNMKNKTMIDQSERDRRKIAKLTAMNAHISELEANCKAAHPGGWSPTKKPEVPLYYFAYGSNLNKAQMMKRCPGAVAIGPMVLPKARLVFRGVADVEYDESGKVHGGLWRITKRCERALDRYEGVAGGLYRKAYIEIELPVKGERVARRCLLYVMNSKGYCPPGFWYLGTIRKGYMDFGLDTAALREATQQNRRDCLQWEAA